MFSIMVFSTCGSFNIYILFESLDGLWVICFEYSWFFNDELGNIPFSSSFLWQGCWRNHTAGLRQLLGDLVTMRTFCKAMLLMGSYFLVAVVIFSNLEDWNWADVVYFSIITLMTVSGAIKSVEKLDLSMRWSSCHHPWGQQACPISSQISQISHIGWT